MTVPGILPVFLRFRELIEGHCEYTFVIEIFQIKVHSASAWPKVMVCVCVCVCGGGGGQVRRAHLWPGSEGRHVFQFQIHHFSSPAHLAVWEMLQAQMLTKGNLGQTCHKDRKL